MDQGRVLTPDDVVRIRKMISSMGEAAPRGKFDFTINIQLLIGTLIAALFLALGWGFNTMLGYQQFQQKIDAFTTSTQAQLTSQSLDIKALGDQLNLMRQGNIQLRDQTAKWQSDMSAQNVDQQKQLSSLDKNVAVIQERVLERQRDPGPRGELALPEKFGSLEHHPFVALWRPEIPHLGPSVGAAEFDHP